MDLETITTEELLAELESRKAFEEELVQEGIKEKLRVIFKKSQGTCDWPRSYEELITVKCNKKGYLNITVRDVDEVTFADLEKVAAAVGSKHINFGLDHWEGGSDVTPMGGTDLELTVKYDHSTR